MKLVLVLFGFPAAASVFCLSQAKIPIAAILGY
jgi:hypothetical protein